MSENNGFRCEICHQFYSTKFTLRRHIKVKHPQKKFFKSPESGDESFSYDKLGKHVENHEQMKNGLKCPLCSYVSYFSVKLNDHIKCSHGINIEVETHQFKSFEEFLKWKHDIEKKETSKFVKYCGNSKIKDGIVRSYYYCHRSYVHKSYVVHRMKKLKKQGLAKIGAHCPASMKVLNKRDGAIKVHYIKTHLGHEKEMCYINLSIEERKYLASLISKNMSFDQILSDIKDCSDLNKSEKLKYVTRSDLHNIRRSFNLCGANTAVSNQDDLVGTDMWVSQQLSKSDCCVLLYKPQGVDFDTDPNLPNNLYFLAIMTRDQETVLIQQNFTCICLDLIQSININDIRFDFISLFVIDSKNQEFPAAFLITTKADMQSLEVFLTLIRNKTGILNTNIFLSNMNDCFLDTWSKVMQLPQVRLYCSWHVNRLWRLALQKINSPEDESKACEIITELIEEKDKNLFTNKLKAALENLCSNQGTRRFGEYFKETFAANTESWAYCYRKLFGLETDIQLERIHRTLKYLFVNVKTLKRLDKSITEIEKFVQDKFFNKGVPPSEEVRISNMKEIDNRHRTSLRLDLDGVTAKDSGWKINSKSRICHTYIIYDVAPNCNCSLICEPCKVCIHRFCCSCNDSSVMWRMCKHIHLLCRAVDFSHSSKEINNIQVIQQSSKENENISSDSQLVNQFLQMEFNSSELDGLVESICLNKTSNNVISDSLEEKKTNLKRKFSEMLEIIKTENEANLIQSSLEFLMTTLTGKNNDIEHIYPANESCNETLPALSSSLLYKTNGPKVNNLSFNTQIAQSQYIIKPLNDFTDTVPPLPPLVPLKSKQSTPYLLLNQKDDISSPLSVQLLGLELGKIVTKPLNDFNDAVPPLPPLVPLKSKQSTPYLSLNQKDDISSPLTVQLLGLELENPDLMPFKSGNVIVLMNKTINDENG